MSRDVAMMPATELLANFRAKKLSPVDAAKASLARIGSLNGRLNAFCLVDEAGALAAARASEQRWQRGEPQGLLDGVPATVKDIVLAKGWPTLRGSKAISKHQPWDEDSPAVARLREHGAVLLGRTTTPEFGWKGVTDSPLTGITRNPWNDSMTPGGSSGGAAVAAATGMGALHVGSDGGGSIRIPAGFTGIFGFKQSFGRVPAYPLSPFGTISHVGPMTRTVADGALMLTVLSSPDARDWYALPPDGRNYLEGLDDGVRAMRIAFAPTITNAAVDSEIGALVSAAARRFAELGAQVEEVTLPLPDSYETFERHWYPGAAHVLSAFNAEQRGLLDAGLVEIAEAGARLPVLDYLAAVKAREAMGVQMNLFHQTWDLLLTPTLPIPAFSAGRELPEGHPGRRWMAWTPFTYPFNLTRQPAASVPCGLTRSGLPAGLQIVGPLYEDARVLRAARAFERASPWPLPPL